MFDIYEKIQFLLKTHNLKASELEKQLSFSNGTISKWKKSIPSIDKIYLLSNYFDISLESFLSISLDALVLQGISVIGKKSAHSDFQFSTEEYELLRMYRELDPRDQQDIFDFVKLKYDKSSKKGATISSSSTVASDIA